MHQNLSAYYFLEKNHTQLHIEIVILLIELYNELLLQVKNYASKPFACYFLANNVILLIK